LKTRFTRFTTVLLPSAAVLFTTSSLLAAVNPWLGTWKLNHEKSSYTGSYTLTKTPKGYLFEVGQLKYEVGDDGKDYPTVAPDTYSLKQTGTGEWLGVDKVGGKETSRDTMTLSADGKSLKEKTTGTHADGSTYTSEETDTRIGSGSGLAGTWMSTQVSSTSPGLFVVSDAGGGKYKYFSPANKGGHTLALDGKPVSFVGPRASASETIGAKSVSESEQSFIVYMKGKPFVEGTDTLSADKKVMTETSWLVDKPTEKTIEIYEKQ